MRGLWNRETQRGKVKEYDRNLMPSVLRKSNGDEQQLREMESQTNASAARHNLTLVVAPDRSQTKHDNGAISQDDEGGKKDREILDRK